MKIIKGLAALTVLLGLVAGVPIALFALAGNPLERLPEVLQLLSRPDYGGIIFFSTILPIIGWALWAFFTLSVAIEIPSAVRGIKAPRIRGLGSMQGVAATLLAAVIALFGVVGPANAATFDTSSQSSHIVITAPQQAGGHTTDQAQAAAAAQKTDSPETFTHTVESGDTLWGLAEKHLGDGLKYKQIQDCNPGILDADEIYTGDQINIPVAQIAPVEKTQPKPAPKAETPDTTTSEKSAPGQLAVDTQDRSSAVENALSAPAPEPVQETPPPAQEQVSEDDSAMGDTFLQTTAGIGGLLAAGLLALIGKRRWHQRRLRKAGQRTSPVSAAAASTEREIRDVEAPITQEKIDQALRVLATWATENGTSLPKIFCLRASTGALTFYLSEPKDLPEPWAKEDDEGTVWSLHPMDVPEPEAYTDAPYPAMVTIGEDTKDAQILIDAEYIGALGIEDHHNGSSHHILTALAVELACSPWSEQLTISLCGVADDLPEALGTGRVTSYATINELLTMLQGRAADVRAAMHAAGVSSLHEARTLPGQSWMPEIVLLGVEPTERQRHQLMDLVGQIPRLGIAAITAGFTLGDWKLSVDSEGYATLAPVGLMLKPQKIIPEQQEAIIELLAQSAAEAEDLDDGTSPDAGETPAAVEDVVIHIHHVDAPSSGFDADGLQNVPIQPQDEPVAEPVEDLATELPVTDDQESIEQPVAETPTIPLEASGASPDDEHAAPVAETEPDEEPVLATVIHLDDRDLQETAGDAELQPADNGMSPLQVSLGSLDPDATELLGMVSGDTTVIRLLGTVEILNARGVEPTSPSTGKPAPGTTARCVGLLAYLALHPGATTEQYNEAFWPNTEVSGAKAAQNRNKLSNLTRAYLGQAEDGTMLFPHARDERYRLDEQVLCDWTIFTRLIGDNVQTVSLPRLVAALRLVRGAPFEGIRPKNYLWNERNMTEMIEVISMAAHELVDRAMAKNDAQLARLGALVGRTVDPANEQAWRDAITAEHLAKDRSGVEEIVEKFHDYLGAFDEDSEPEDETQQLLNELREVGYRVA
ncbi:LysM peptidoglycan-binding domain-containing protein [Paeniglutamicibacter sp. MACA_103]|uniref:LysM peptidoglycan-binding domain-containing protein n=1 Tax=Paeniglutamicibacter sp. MACA_103 TaxID=3377337 RepID=UPI003896343A